jgi:beta-galactosidase/beta-glucuronidase
MGLKTQHTFRWGENGRETAGSEQTAAALTQAGAAGKAGPSLLVAATATSAIPLDGKWLLATDPENVGRAQRWYARTLSTAKPARVPGIIQEVFPAYHGVAWYWREFGVPAHPHRQGRYLIRFGAVDYLADVHTGNHCPISQIIPPNQTPGLLRRDLLYAKVSGFNTVRFISGVSHPYQLDLCDEIRLMVYEESYAAWLLADSPKMRERYELSIREMVLRDRNHPSLTIWGMLNETDDTPVFREAVSALRLVRSLDDTRLVLLSSGRWDANSALVQ